jgi:hypothetical protein
MGKRSGERVLSVDGSSRVFREMSGRQEGNGLYPQIGTQFRLQTCREAATWKVWHAKLRATAIPDSTGIGDFHSAAARGWEYRSAR